MTNFELFWLRLANLLQMVVFLANSTACRLMYVMRHYHFAHYWLRLAIIYAYLTTNLMTDRCL